MGVAVRIQGLRRYYALMFAKDETVSLIKVRDDKRFQIASTGFEWQHGVAYDLYIQAKGERLTGCVGGMEITADDAEYHGGAMGLVVTTGSLGADSISIGPVMESE